MGSIRDRLLAKEEEKKKNGVKTSGTSIRDRLMTEDRLNEVGSTIQNRINNWLTSSNDYFKSSSSRYSTRDNSVYGLEDSIGWKETVTSQKDWFNKEAENINKLLSSYEKYFDKDWVANVRNTLNSTLRNQEAVVNYADGDIKYWSQWDNEDAYYNDYFGNKYSGKTYADIQEAMGGTEGKEKAWLSINADNYMSSAEAQAEIDRLSKVKKPSMFGGISATATETAQYKVAQDRIAVLKTIKNKAELKEKNSEFLKEAEEDPAYIGYVGRGEKRGSKITECRNDPQKLLEESAKAFGAGGGIHNSNALKYAIHMTDDEYETYVYFLGKYGEGKANEYLDTIEESINAREAGRIAKTIDTPLEYVFFGAKAGIDQFASGMKSLFSGEDYIPASPVQMASGIVRENLSDTGPKLPEWLGGSSLGQVGYDAITTTTNMLPSIFASVASNAVVPGSGAFVGTGLLGASAAGHGKAEMLNLGYSKGQATAYGLMVGAAEGGLQYLLGGITSLGGNSSGLTKWALSKVDNALARVAITVGSGMISEGFEEGLQTAIEPWLKEIATGVDWESPEIDEVLYSSLLGAISSLGFEGIGSVSGEVQYSNALKNTGKNILSSTSGYDALKNLATEVSSEGLVKNEANIGKLVEKTQTGVDAINNKTASKHQQNKTYKQIGKLSETVNSVRNEQNLAEIQSSLEGKGLSKTDAKRAAQLLNEALYTDGAYSKELYKSVMKDEGVWDTLRELVSSPTKSITDSQDTNIAEQIQALAKEYTESSSTLKRRNIKHTLGRMGLKVGEDGTITSSVKAEETESKYVDESLSFIEDASQRKYTASAEGKSIVNSTEDTIDIVEVASIKDGQMMLKVKDADGVESVVNARDISYASESEALVYEAVANMGLNAVSANSIIKSYNPTQDAGAFARGMQEAYRYGKYNYSEYEMYQEGNFLHDLTEEQIQKAYKLGQIQSGSDTAVAVAKLKEAIANSKGKKGEGKVHFEGDAVGIDENNLNDRQKVSLKTMEMLSKALGIEFYVYSSSINKNGERVYKTATGEVKSAPNGWYDKATGAMHIDLNAGNFGEETMLFTVAHELTHFIKAWSPAKFKVLANFLVEQYGKKGVSVEELVSNQMKHMKANGHKNVTYDLAFEEFVADSMQSMLTSGNVMETLAELKRRDEGLWNKIKEFFANLVDLLKKTVKAYEGYDPDTIEGQTVAEMTDAIEQFEKLFAEGLVDASENFRAISGTEQQTLAEVGIGFDEETRSVAPELFSERTWTASEYVKNKEEAIKTIAKQLGVSENKARQYVDDINSIARLIADDRVRLDYEPNMDDGATVLKPNSEYKYTVDMSTLCAKRLLFTGTFDAIQKALPNTVFDSDDIVRLRKMMQKRNLEVACGICYVESTRREIGRITQEFIDRYKVAQKTGRPITRVNSSGKEVALSVKGKTFMADPNYTPNLGELNTTDIDIVKRDHREVYDAYLAFMNARGQAKPKLLETRAEYKGEILKHFKAKSAVNSRNAHGGLRLQSFSDFEVPHMIDMMQVVMDMSRVGLKSQAYTKVPAFAEVFGGTGVKINLSLIAKGSGLDADGNLVFDDIEGINHKEAFRLRDKFSRNVGTILVGKSDAHIIAAMANPRIDFIIPFHKSSWKESLYDALGLTGYDDYTDAQNEKPIDKERKIENFDPSEYWDFSKSGDENAQIYLQKCREDGRIPKFAQFQSYPGYWKLLIDFKMYDNNGVGVPQEVVRPDFDMDSANRILSEYKGGHKTYPVAKDVVEDFVKEFREEDVLYSERAEYRKEIEQWAKDGMPDGETFVLGSTGDVLQGLGAIENDIYMLGEKIKTILSDHPELSLDEIKKIPQILDDPLLILKSRNVGRGKKDNTRLVIFGSVKAKNGQPVLSVLDIRPTEGKLVIDDMQKVVSAYTKDNDPISYIRNSEVMYADKKRATSLLRTIGFHMPIELNKSGFIGSISYIGQNVKMDGEKFSDVFIETDENPHSDRKIVDIPNNKYVEMYHHFGSTKNYDVAGYMLGNGIMLDFSGKHWGDDYSTSRQVDHRDVQEVLDDRGNNGVNAMIDMIGNGNIRLMPEVGGINLAVKPNATQMSQLRGYINHFKGEVVIDIDKVGGDTIHYFSYTRGTSSSKILSDLKAYFDEGIVPEQKASDETNIRDFLYSDRNKDAEYLNLAKNPEENEARLRQLVEEAARNAGYNSPKLYHGTKMFGFTKVKTSGVEKGVEWSPFFAANKEDISASYVPYGKVRDIYSSMDDDAIEEARESAIEERKENISDLVDEFRSLIDRHISPWVFGHSDNSYLEELVEEANPEPGSGDGVYDVLSEVVFSSFYDYQDELGEYEDADDWAENSPEGNEIFSKIVEIEGEKSALHSIESGEELGGIYQLYANLDNMYAVDGKGAAWNKLRPEGLPKIDRHGFKDVPYKTRDVAEWARENGFDGVIFKNIRDNGAYGRTPAGDVYVFFHPESQVKSADPVTYDDGGNVIPLSERFNSENDDIRYSDRNKDSVSNRSLLANALESAVTNEFERKTLNDYKEELGRADALEKELGEIRSKIRELSFAKDPKDTEALKKLREQEVKTVNRIDIRDKKLLRLEATKPLKDIIHRERDKAYKRAEKEGKEALAKYREKTAETQRELLNRWQESRHKAVEGRNKTAMRHKIRGIVSELNNLLLHGTKDKHIMIGLQKAVASALDAVNMDTVGAEERVAKYNALIAKEKNPDVIESLTATRDRILAQGDKLGEKLANLKNAYSEIKNSDDPLIANSYDEVIFSKIEAVVTSVGDTALRDMSLSQLEDVYDLYKMVLTTIRNSNKAFKAKKGEEISVLGNRVMEEVETVGGKKNQRLKALEGIKQYGWNILKPVYAFKLIGSKTFSEVFDNVRAGEDTWARDIDEAQAFRTATFKKYNYKSWDFNKKYKFTSKAGVSFDLTLEQMLSLYAYSKRKQADDHLEKGGFVFDTAIEVTEKKHGIPLKYNVNTATAHNLSKETLAQIIGNLSTEQKGFVDEMQDYLSTVMGEKGNEVSLEMYGVKLFKEKFYFPLKSARQFMFEQNEVAGEVKIKNSGFSKETVAHANNPIILDNFMDVWANHVNDMSMYHSFVLALEDFNRVFNYKTPTADNMPTESVKMYLQNAYGTEAASYIKQLLTDLNGGARSDPQAGIINKAIGKFKKAKVFASMSVVVQQPSALGRAFAYVDPKYFVGKKVNKNEQMKTWNEVKKYAPVAIIKEMGYFDVGNGRSTVNYLKGDKSIMDRVDDVASWLPAKADELTWCTIWEAVKRETADKNKALKVGSEEFLKTAGERFTEVIVNTQVYDSVLSRSGMMRSKDTGVKMATAFMAEPTTAMNMMVDAHLQTKRGDKKSARRIRGGVITSVLINSILVAFVYASRDDDEDETYAEKYLGSLTSEVIDGLNPLTYLPYVKDIWSIAQGYDVERSDMSVFADLWGSFEKLFDEDASALDKVTNFTGDVTNLFGLPLKNVWRDVEALFNVANGIIGGTQTTSAGIGYSVMDAVRNAVPIWGRLDSGPSKSQKLYNALASGDQVQIDRLKGGYKDEEAYENAVKKAIRDNDKDVKKMVKAFANGDFSSVKYVLETVASRYGISESLADEIIDAEYNYYKGKITDAAKALKEGKTSEYKDIVKTLRERYRGVYSQDDIVNAVKEKPLEPTEESFKIEEAESVYETWQINSALENGDTDTATAIVDDLVRVKTENYLAKAKAEAEKNGKKFNENTALKEAEKKARSSVKSSITSHWKPLYKEAYKNKDSEEMLRIRQLLLATGVYGRTSELLDTVTGWLKD